MSPLTAIGKGVYLSRGEETGADSSHPNVIVMFGWMGAKLPHLQKYTNVYQKTYPGATQLLIQCDPAFFWSSRKKREAILAPAVAVLRALGCVEPKEGTSPPRIITHIFSNGGSFQLITLGQMMRFSMPLSTVVFERPNAFILDSCPGSGGLQSSQRAFTAGITNPIGRMLLNVLVLAIHVYSVIADCAFGHPQTIQIVQTGLNTLNSTDPGEKDALCLPPWIGNETPRLYIYSKKDDLIPWEQVQEHGAIAQATGVAKVVNRVVFEDTPHVAHMRADPGRYWSAVEDFWNASKQ